MSIRHSRMCAIMPVIGLFLVLHPAFGTEAVSLDKSLGSASYRGTARKVAGLLQQGADPNSCDSRGRTPLHFAAQAGHGQVISLLLEAGADIDAKDQAGKTALDEAISFRQSDAVQLLITSGATPTEDALGSAAWLGDLESVKALLAVNVPPNAGVQQAAQGGHAEVVQVLIDAGADPRLVGASGNSPLHLAALQGGPETVQVLLNHGANPNALNEEDQSPLHMAVSGDADIQVVKRLVEAGAKLDTADAEGVTPVRRASLAGEVSVYKWLVQINGGAEPKPMPPMPPMPPNESLAPLATLIADASSEDFSTRRMAQRKLVLRGEEAAIAIVEAIESGTHIEPFLAVFARMGPTAEVALPILQRQLADKKYALTTMITMIWMRPGIVEALPEKEKQVAADALYKFAIDPESDILAGFAVGMLVKLGDTAIDNLVRLLGNERVELRSATADFLKESPFRDLRLADALLEAVSTDPSVDVRAAAAVALAAMDRHEEPARQAMLTIVKQVPPYPPPSATEEEWKKIGKVRSNAETAARALGAFGAASIEDLIPLLTPMERPQRTPAITGLVAIGKPAIPRLVELLEHKDSTVATSASIALDRIGMPAVPALIQALQDGREQVVVRGAAALSRIGRGAEGAVPTLLEIAGPKRGTDASRMAAMRAAVKIDPAVAEHPAIVSTVPVLMRLLEKGSFHQQGEAARLLGVIGPPARAALPLLRQRTAPPDRDVDTEGLVPDFVLEAAQDAIEAIGSDADTQQITPSILD